MGEIGRAHDRVFEAIPHVLTVEQHTAVSEALNGVYQVGWNHGQADYEAEHADDEPNWVKGARELAVNSSDDKLLGAYVRVFVEQL